jgi:peptidyl-prolyl cis-trans isomerase C
MSAQASAADSAPIAPVVRIDGVEIPESEIAREMQHHPAGSLAEARHMAIQALIVRRLLVGEAERQGIAVADADAGDAVDDPRIALLLEREIRTPEPDQAACRRYFENNRQLFDRPERYDAAHILLASPADDQEARKAGIEEARNLIAVLQSEPDRFAELALAHSDCPSRDQGGRLGLVSRGETVPEFETFLFSLKPGELCPVPIESRYGVHIIRLDRKLPGEAADFLELHEEIAAYLRLKSRHMALRQYLLLLAGQADIEGFEMEAAHSPLVQ